MSWKVKYRPNTLEELAGHDNIKIVIQNILDKPIVDMPHMLFKGDPGTGKTTLAEIIMKTSGCQFKELNTSDERGIDIVKGTIKNYAKTRPLVGDVKILLLDEADNITADGQKALRRIMEKYEYNCKFILTCNYPQKIIPAIHSRCEGAIFELNKLSYDDVHNFVYKILEKENITLDSDAFDEFYNQSQGDMRAIDILYTLSLQTNHITLEDILQAVKSIDNDVYVQLVKYLKNNDHLSACNLITPDQIPSIFKKMMNDDTIKNKKKIAIKFAEYDFRKSFAVTQYIQLYALIANLIKIIEV